MYDGTREERSNVVILLTVRHCVRREELRGVKRGKEDVDWSKVANTITAETIAKPSPIKISVSEVLSKVKSNKIQTSTAVQTDVIDMNGMSREIFIYFIFYPQCLRNIYNTFIYIQCERLKSCVT